MNTGPGHHAGIVSRGAAFSIDVVIALIAASLGYLVVVAMLDAVGVTSRSSAADSAVLANLLGLPVVFAAYCAGFWALQGRTPGMMVLGLRVVTRSGAPPGVGRCIVRALGYWVSAIALLGFAWIAIDRQRQGFHDKLAGTYVVYDVPGGGTSG